MPPELKSLHIDASAGIAGDMLLAALLDLGVPREAVFGPFEALEGFPRHEIVVEKVERRSIEAVSLRIRPLELDPPHRGLVAIEAIIDQLDLPERAETAARACFRRIAEAEGAVHGIPAEEIHFHEIGAVDSLIDIIGVCLAVAWLDPDHISCSSLPLGSGTVQTAHGILPIPAPATLRLLEGIPTHPFSVGREVTTPTGAALAATLADRFGDPPAGTIAGSGWGAGGRIAPPEDPPNLLRVWTLSSSQSPKAKVPSRELEKVTILETNLDTVSGEESGDYIAALIEAGALDAWIVPIIAKKGRPGMILCALAPSDRAAELRQTIFRLTGTLGVRQRDSAREILPRDIVEFSFEGRTVRVKRAWHEGELLWERPEHDDVAAIAAETDRPLREIRARIEEQLAERRRRGDR